MGKEMDKKIKGKMKNEMKKMKKMRRERKKKKREKGDKGKMMGLRLLARRICLWPDLRIP